MLITTNIALVVLAATGLTLPFFLLLFAVLLPHTFLINPVARGFKSITGKALYKEVAKIRREHPDARWAVFGPVPFAAFIKHCGVQVVNGNKFYPVPEFNRLSIQVTVILISGMHTPMLFSLTTEKIGTQSYTREETLLLTR